MIAIRVPGTLPGASIIGTSGARFETVAFSSSSSICARVMATKVLLSEPAGKRVSPVTGAGVAIGEADPAGPLDTRRSDQRHAGAGHAGFGQETLNRGPELIERLRRWVGGGLRVELSLPSA